MAETLYESGAQIYPYFFSPSGSELVFFDQNRNVRDIGMVAIDGDAEPTWLLETEFLERNAELSPDGNWMAYESNESGDFEIYVSPFPNTSAGKQQVSRNGGRFPLWSRDGRELFYVESGGQPRLMAVPVDTSAAFASGNPEAVVDFPYFSGNPGRPYDVSPDGRRFLVIASAGSNGEAGPQIITVLNWTEELKQRVPVP